MLKVPGGKPPENFARIEKDADKAVAFLEEKVGSIVVWSVDGVVFRGKLVEALPGFDNAEDDESLTDEEKQLRLLVGEVEYGEVGVHGKWAKWDLAEQNNVFPLELPERELVLTVADEREGEITITSGDTFPEIQII